MTEEDEEFERIKRRIDLETLPLINFTKQKEWVGLTRMELIKCGVFPWGMSYKLYEAIEAKLKEKNCA